MRKKEQIDHAAETIADSGGIKRKTRKFNLVKKNKTRNNT